MTLNGRSRRFLLNGFAGATIAGLIGASLVRVAGLIRQVLTARAFGLGPELDAFLLATLIPTMVGAVTGAALNAALLPHLVGRDRVVTSADSRSQFWTLFWYTTIIGLGLGLLLWAGADLLSAAVTAGSDDPTLTRTVTGTFRILAVVPLLVIQYEVLAAGLVARKRFLQASILPIFTPLAIGGAILTGTRSASGLAIATLVGGAVIVAVGMLVAGQLYGHPFRMPRMGRDNIGLLGRETSAFVVAMLLAQATIVVDRLMANSLGPGSVSALEFGSRVPEAVLGVLALALANAIAQRAGDLTDGRRVGPLVPLMKAMTRWILLLGSLLAIVLILLSPVMVEFLFVGQNFSVDDGALVAGIQMAYLAQTPFYLLSVAGARVMASLRRGRVVAVIALVHLVLNVAGNMLLMPVLGVVGVALGTSLTYAITGTGVWIYATRGLRVSAQTHR